MKKLFKKLPLLAFVLALVGAFAFNVPEEEALAIHWFDLDPNGFIGSPIATSPSCDGSTVNCAVGLDETQVDMNGDPIYSTVAQYGGEDEVLVLKED